MKKLDIISFIAIIVATVGLVLLDLTGLPGHIAIAVIALIIMIVCAVRGKKDWKKPALEIAYRVFYFITLITGVVMIATQITGAVAIVHKAACAVFAVLFIVNFITKLAKK